MYDGTQCPRIRDLLIHRFLFRPGGCQKGQKYHFQPLFQSLPDPRNRLRRSTKWFHYF